MKRILLVEDFAVVRAGIKMMLENEQDLKICGEAPTKLGAITQLKSSVWDLVILDISLPDASGVEVLDLIKRYKPDLPVLIFSMHSEERFANELIFSGASGYIQKDCCCEELIFAIRTVLAGNQYMSAKVSLHNSKESHTPLLHKALTNRESQVFYKLCNGASNQEISRVLDLAPQTVSCYRRRILQIMNMSNNTELVKYAVFHGLTALTR